MSVGGGGSGLEVGHVPAGFATGVAGAVAGEGLGFFSGLRLTSWLLQKDINKIEGCENMQSVEITTGKKKG